MRRRTIPRALPVAGALLMALPLPAHAQGGMAGMRMDAPQPSTTAAPVNAPAAADPPPDDATGTDQPPGSAPPPPVAHDMAGARYWGAEAMHRAHEAMMKEQPAPLYGAVKMDLAEYQFGRAGDSWRWEGEGWLGDANRLWVRSRGEGPVGSRLEDAEVEVAYSRAVSPWWNLQAGMKQDIRPTPARTHAMLAVQGLAPYRFEILVAAYLSDTGQWTGRIEATAEERITRRFVLQPRAELLLSAQDMPAQRLGAGLTSAEAGLRLRYEVTRKFAPYLGVSWLWTTGRTAQDRRIDGQSPAARTLVLGIKSWF
jgi:copper resistance protein B